MDAPTLSPVEAEAERQRLAECLDAAREALIGAAKHADALSAHGTHMKAMTAVAVVDDALTALSDGVAR